jgi:hypothetical protein
MKRSKALAFIEAFKKVREVVSDDIAKENIGLYPEWVANKELENEDRVHYDGKLYKVIQTHTTQETWTPDITPTLFEPIDVANDGTLDNPFIAASGMTYYKDKYYLDETDGKVYLCTRDDTGNGTVLHYMPHDLVGVYFELVA